jgi:hypothetical protein
MPEQSADYVAFLLRLWSVNNQGTKSWRASLQHAQTGEIKSFASPDALFDYLRARTTSLSPPETTVLSEKR